MRYIVELGRVGKDTTYMGDMGIWTYRRGWAKRYSTADDANEAMCAEQKKYGFPHARIVEVEEVEG